MKKIYTIILMILMIMPTCVNAASGTVKVTSSSTAVYGNTITFTVTLASSTSIGSWQMDLNYDKSYLQLQSTTSEGGGISMVNSSSSGTKSKTYTYTFKTLKTGSTKVEVSSYLAYAFSDMSEMSLTSTSKTISIKTQEEIEASYSKDSSLKSLSIDDFDLNEEFDKDVFEYSVDVSEDTKEVVINASKNDSNATVSGTGSKEVTHGINSFDIVVRAQNGSESTYKLVVNVVDNDPIEVDGGYSVVKYMDSISEYPKSFTETTINIGEFVVPAFSNDVLDILIVALKSSSGDIEFFIYEDGEYSKYNEITFSNLSIMPIKSDEVIDGHISVSSTINGVESTVFKVSKDSRFSIFYGVNVYTGESAFYKYDEIDSTVMVLDSEYSDKLLEDNNLYTYIIFGFAGALGVCLLMIISLLKRGSKSKNKDKLNKEIDKLLDSEKKENIKSEKKNRKKKDVSGDVVVEELTTDILDEKSKPKKEKKVKKSKKKEEIVEEMETL